MSSNSALHLAVINSQQEVVQCLIDIMAGLPESYISEYNFLRQVSHAIYHIEMTMHLYELHDGYLVVFFTLISIHNGFPVVFCDFILHDGNPVVFC